MKKLWVENNENLPAVVWSETQPQTGDFLDRTNDLISWDKYGKYVLDFERYRYEMKAPFYGEAGIQLENWGLLSAEKKLIGAKYFFVPYQLRLTVLNDQQDFDNWESLLFETQGLPVQRYVGRARTFDEMRRCVAHMVRTEQMTMESSQDMLKSVGLMSDWFIRANAPDLKQWITNEVGSVYENNGFAQKNYFNAALRDKLYDIYNGNY